MKPLVIIAAVLATSLTAQASPAQKFVRVDRPSMAAGARVTYIRVASGTVTRRMRATVLSDTNCTPDRQGVSHCLNRMRLANNKVILAIHDHSMMNMPCLSPGEHV